MPSEMAIDGTGDSHDPLHALEAVAVDVLIDAQGMLHRPIDHMAVGVGKAEIMREEVGMGIDMGDDEEIGDLELVSSKKA